MKAQAATIQDPKKRDKDTHSIISKVSSVLCLMHASETLHRKPPEHEEAQTGRGLHMSTGVSALATRAHHGARLPGLRSRV